MRLGRREATYPSEAFQRDCLRIIANKTLPDLAAQQLTGANDKPLFHENVTELELSSWIAGKLSLADDKLGGGTAGAIEAPVETLEHVSGEQSQRESAARAAERLAVSKSVTVQPAIAPLDYNERLLRKAV